MNESTKLLIGHRADGNVLFFQRENETKKPIVMYPESDRLFGGSAYTIERFLRLVETNKRTREFLNEIGADWFISILRNELNPSERMEDEIKTEYKRAFGTDISEIQSERPLKTRKTEPAGIVNDGAAPHRD